VTAARPTNDRPGLDKLKNRRHASSTTGARGPFPGQVVVTIETPNGTYPFTGASETGSYGTEIELK
jgi:hypothetical protein